MKFAKITRYVAIGDSNAEGLGDTNFSDNRMNSGWCDRLAHLLSLECAGTGSEFRYANLAIRGKKLAQILDEQLEEALALQPDFVTIMAGSNDWAARDLQEHRDVLDRALKKLHALGIRALVSTTIRPSHLRFFKVLMPKCTAFSEMVRDVCQANRVEILDIYAIESFSNLNSWSDDMVHFSETGHVAVANLAAQQLGLTHRFVSLTQNRFSSGRRSPLETIAWFGRDVVPFIGRRLRGVSSGDGLYAKHSNPVRLDSAWPQDSAVVPQREKVAK